jgi:hypothetical protein
LNRLIVSGITVSLCAVSGLVGYRLGGARGREAAPPAQVASTGPAIATYEGSRIDSAALRARIRSEGPLAQNRFRTESALKDYLLEWIHLDLLSERARAAGLDQEPNFQRDQQRRLAAMYVQKFFETPEKAKTVSDEEVRAYYEAHHNEFSRPETFQVAHVLFKVPDPSSKASAKSRAQRALRDLEKKLPQDPYAFEDLARNSSEDPLTRASGGRLPPMGKEQLKHQFGKAFVSAIQAQDGKPHAPPVVVETPAGFDIVTLIRHEQASETPFSSVAAQLRSRLQTEKSQADYQAFLGQLEQDAHVTIDDAVLRDFLTSVGKRR